MAKAILSEARKGTCNDYPQGVGPSGPKRRASHWDDDIVSAGKKLSGAASQPVSW